MKNWRQQKALDKTDDIEQYTVTHPNFSMSPLLISESVGELQCEICVSSLVKKLLQLVTLGTTYKKRRHGKVRTTI